MLKVLFGLALTLRLLLDMATPLMPGAFRFHPSESVEAHQTHSVRGASQAVVRPGAPAQPGRLDVMEPRFDAPLRFEPHVRAPRFRPLLTRHTPDQAAEAAEDH